VTMERLGRGGEAPGCGRRGRCSTGSGGLRQSKGVGPAGEMPMIRVLSVLLLASAPAVAEETRPPVPDWQTDAACTWEWREGGGFGLWTERCALSTGLWEILWDAEAGAFIQVVEGEPWGSSSSRSRRRTGTPSGSGCSTPAGWGGMRHAPSNRWPSAPVRRRCVPTC
jgi:hypothetical protein